MITKFLRSLLAALAISLAFPVGSVLGCSIPTPQFYDATRYPADVVVEGIAIETGTDGRNGFAIAELSEAMFGNFTKKHFRIDWHVYTGGGRCAPPGPYIENGQKVRAYLRASGERFRPLAWEYVAEVKKTKEQIGEEQAIARIRDDRDKRYYQVGGALSYDDPKKWLSLAELPGVENWKYGISISFEVAQDGSVYQCETDHIEKAAKYDKMACKILTNRIKLVPPLFASEAAGYFWWDPHIEALIAKEDESVARPETQE